MNRKILIVFPECDLLNLNGSSERVNGFSALFLIGSLTCEFSVRRNYNLRIFPVIIVSDKLYEFVNGNFSINTALDDLLAFV